VKKVVALAVVAVVAVLIWQKVSERTLEAEDLTPEDRIVRSLDERIDKAKDQIVQASRAAGLSGVDSGGEAEAALRELDRIESEIRSLKSGSDSSRIHQECDRLMSKVEAARR